MTDNEDLAAWLMEAQKRAHAVRTAAAARVPQAIARARPGRLSSNEISLALKAISPQLADSYLQIKADLDDAERLSWAGTAHEIRQILASLLDTLAPDEKVVAQPGYRRLPNTTGPTQAQRVQYILQSRVTTDSSVRKVVEDVDVVNERVSKLVRNMYGRASNAAHRFKDRVEVRRILKYFEAFLEDLLDLQPSPTVGT